MSNSSNKGVAVVTGASSGIGAVYADRLAKRGYNLILVARNEARLKSLSARLTSETGRSIKVLPGDLSNKAELAKVEATLRDDPSITILVNNAGTASVAPLLNADVNKMDDMIALNITALTRRTYAVAPALSRVAQAPSSTSDRWWASRPRRSTVCTARAKPMSLR